MIALKRNPQYLSERQSKALQKSIERDGFLAPIVVRRKGELYEILSGNHRVIASREAGLVELPCVLVDPCDDRRAARIAVNMNTVHGDPTAELLAPFLAEMDDETLGSVFMGDDLAGELIEFDSLLKERLDSLAIPDAMDTEAVGNIPNCICKKCGNRHVRARKRSARSPRKAKSTAALKPS